MHNNFLSASLLLLTLSCASGSGTGHPPLEVVPQVDIKRYTGIWYEIASFPQSFQKGCTNTKATYTLQQDGTVEVLNSCFRNGKVDTARGKAWVVDATTNAKLKVSFFWPFRGDYWIIGLGDNYEYAVVAAPNRKYLWILSREQHMDGPVYEKITAGLKERGFDIGLLQRTILTTP